MFSKSAHLSGVPLLDSPRAAIWWIGALNLDQWNTYTYTSRQANQAVGDE